jgi:hypothetical protein
MECWSVRLGVTGVVAGVNAIGFVDDQCFGLSARIPLCAHRRVRNLRSKSPSANEPLYTSDNPGHP